MHNLNAQLDLRWYFDGSAEAALGMRSSWGPLCDLAQSGIAKGGGVKTSDPVTEHQILAVERERRIREALRQLTQRDALTLWAVYTPRAGLDELDRFGRLAGLALYTQTARAAYRKAQGKERARGMAYLRWLGHESRRDEGLFARVLSAAAESYAQAIRSYQSATTGAHATAA